MSKVSHALVLPRSCRAIGALQRNRDRKLRAHGAIPFGRMNMDEFAMGSSTENSSVQQTRNPWDFRGCRADQAADRPQRSSPVMHSARLERTPVDRFGSQRPCAEIVGFKPSYGRVSRFGLVAFASSLDQIGPLTKTVHDPRC